MKVSAFSCYYNYWCNKYSSWININLILLNSKREIILNVNCKVKYTYKEKNIDLYMLLKALNILQEQYDKGLISKFDKIKINSKLVNSIDIFKDSNQSYEKKYANEILTVLYKFKNWTIVKSKYAYSYFENENGKVNNNLPSNEKKLRIPKNQKRSKMTKYKRVPKVIKVKDFVCNENFQLIFLDIEMNCNDKRCENSGGFEIISIGAVKVIDRKIIYNDTFYSTVKPKNNPILSDFCKEITNLTQQEIQNSYPLKVVLKNFDVWVGGKSTVFVTWGREDIRALKRDSKNSGLRLEIINRIRNKNVDFQLEFCTFKLKRKNLISLIKAVEGYDMTLEGQYHNPKDDAINTAKVYLRYAYD